MKSIPNLVGREPEELSEVAMNVARALYKLEHGARALTTEHLKKAQQHANALANEINAAIDAERCG